MIRVPVLFFSRLTCATPSADDALAANKEIVIVVRKFGVPDADVILGDWLFESQDGDIIGERAFTIVIFFVLVGK